MSSIATYKVGTGSGVGEKNYITSPSTSTGWTASGAGITVATDSTAADLPRPNTSKTGILITGVSGSSAYAYFRIILDDADAGKKLKVQFDLKPVAGYVASDFKVGVYSNTAVDYTTGNARLALSTDSAAISAVPNLTGTYRTTFDAPAVSAKWIEFRIGLNGANTHAIVVSDAVVGPGVVVQGAAVSGWTSYTPTITGLGTGSTSANNATWRRVGDVLQVNGTFSKDGSGGTGSTVVQVTLPSGLTINATALGSGVLGSSFSPIGAANTYQILAANQFDRLIEVVAYTATTFAFAKPAVAATMYLGSDLIASSAFSYNYQVAVNEWAGSGTNVVQNDVEYASWDGTSIIRGPGGAQIPTTVVAGISEATDITSGFTNISSGDSFLLELSKGSPDTWCQPTSNEMTSWAYDGTQYRGIHVYTASGAVLLERGKYAQGTGTGAWSALTSPTKWRVKHFRSGSAVGFGAASTTASGLLSYYDEGTFNITFTMAGGFSQVSACRYVRVGKAVTLTFGPFAATATAASVLTGTAFPASLTPAIAVDFAVPARNNGLGIVGALIVTAGVPVLYVDQVGTNFTNASSVGLNYGATICYTTA